ncbi:hypothetical protein SAMN05216249_1373 [Acetitomaculum ruminis DSM 5522]|uniref:Uncharacterized protein n=1 Tax=Acetitomaculum ruminis DSM 5522 TaxID=1120918 RepID=A0A1I1APR5_9FIRM|nr:hypothetical protein [Acetitomaculum ruminis]SFB40039.1 hypothetical protein SAMN05216249_1373 [Acetitomaculum ruminis DSM 5522]
MAANIFENILSYLGDRLADLEYNLRELIHRGNDELELQPIPVYPEPESTLNDDEN